MRQFCKRLIAFDLNAAGLSLEWITKIATGLMGIF
jgi:hypothetical protein